jgi:hypothetical protein
MRPKRFSRIRIYRGGVLFLLSATLSVSVGCSKWLPVTRDPPPIEKPFARVEVPRDTVGIESIVIRLDAQQAALLPEVWASLDEQIVAPELRIALDRNGLRAAKASGHLPPTLEQWVRTHEKRRDDDPLEQVGLAADASTFAQLWRCRAESRKELTVRKLVAEDATVFYFDEANKGGRFRSPHFLYSLQAKPSGDGAAIVRLVPEIKHGQIRRVVVAKDSAIRTDERQDSISWERMAVEMRLNRGDCIVLGATPDPRALGEHFFQTRTKDGEKQHVILLVRLSETGLDDTFVSREASQITHSDRSSR